jgi:hypothetical protein
MGIPDMAGFKQPGYFPVIASLTVYMSLFIVPRFINHDFFRDHGPLSSFILTKG